MITHEGKTGAGAGVTQGKLLYSRSITQRLIRRVPGSLWGDRWISMYYYRMHHGRWPRSRGAATFNEGLFRLKTSGELLEPRRQFISDKEYLKAFVASRVGAAVNVPTIAVVESVEALRHIRIERPAVIKPTHMSGPVIFLIDPEYQINYSEVGRWLKSNYYRVWREQNYRFVRSRIIVEPFLAYDGVAPPRDYKMFCFFGRVAFVQIDQQKFGPHKRRFYGRDWSELPFTIKYPVGVAEERPANWDEMVRVAERLSDGFGFIRVDLYSNGSDVKCGEMTSVPGSGFQQFVPAEVDVLLGPLFSNPTSSVAALLRQSPSLV